MIDMKKFLPIFCLGGIAATTSMLPAASAWADVKAGVDAWSIGNYDVAIKEWKALADRGDPDAEFNLAQAYKLGRGVPMDLRKAQELYRKAAAQGHLQAADVYGLLLFQNGERREAMPYIEASAARGDPRAQYILGLAYFNGDLMRKDWVRAYALVSLANQAGLPQAAHALEQMDQHVPMADRQKSVALSSQIAAEAEATRARETIAADLGSPRPSTPKPAVASAPEIVTAEHAVAEATRATTIGGPATAGADYARPAPAPTPTAAAAPNPAKVAATPKPPPAKPAASKPAPAPSKPAPAAANASGPWRVQLGAFGVAGNADGLWSKLKGRPELAGHGKVLAPAGKLTKLQAGGFASKAAAEAACARLSAGGFSCLAVPD